MIRLRTRRRSVQVTVAGVTVTADPLPMGELSRLAERYTTTKIKRGRPVEKVDSAGLGLALWQAQIVDWDGAADEDGAPLECNDANRAAVWEFSGDWAAEVLEAVDEAAAALEDHEKKA